MQTAPRPEHSFGADVPLETSFERRRSERPGPALQGSLRRARVADRVGDPRQAPGDPPRARVPVRRRSSAHRRRAGRRQDVARQGHRAIGRRNVAPHPVHARPAAVRRHRRVGLGSRTRRLRVPARRRVRQRRAGRRDQPRVAQDPVRVARGDGGAAGHRRRADLRAAVVRSSSSRRRTRSSSKAPIPCPRRSSTVSCSGCASAIPTATPSSRSSTRRTRARSHPKSSSRSPTPKAVAEWSHALGRVHVTPELQGYIVDIVEATRHHRDLLLGVSPRGALGLATRGPRARGERRPFLRRPRRHQAARRRRCSSTGSCCRPRR